MILRKLNALKFHKTRQLQILTTPDPDLSASSVCDTGGANRHVLSNSSTPYTYMVSGKNQAKEDYVKRSLNKSPPTKKKLTGVWD